MADMPRDVTLNIKVNPTAPGPGAKVAKVLQVVNEGGHHARLYIDGELFPWATVDGFTVQASQRLMMPAVSLTIAAYRVEVVDDLNRPAAEQEALADEGRAEMAAEGEAIGAPRYDEDLS